MGRFERFHAQQGKLLFIALQCILPELVSRYRQPQCKAMISLKLVWVKGDYFSGEALRCRKLLAKAKGRKSRRVGKHSESR